MALGRALTLASQTPQLRSSIAAAHWGQKVCPHGHRSVGTRRTSRQLGQAWLGLGLGFGYPTHA